MATFDEALRELGLDVKKRSAVPMSMTLSGNRLTRVVVNTPFGSNEDALLKAVDIAFDLDEMLVPFDRYTTHYDGGIYYPEIWVSGEVS